MPLQHKKEFFYEQLSQTAGSIVIISSLTNYTAIYMKQQLVEMFDAVHDMKIKVKNEIGRPYFTLSTA